MIFSSYVCLISQVWKAKAVSDESDELLVENVNVKYVTCYITCICKMQFNIFTKVPKHNWSTNDI